MLFALSTAIPFHNPEHRPKTVLYGIHFDPLRGRERGRKARAGLSSRGLKAPPPSRVSMLWRRVGTVGVDNYAARGNCAARGTPGEAAGISSMIRCIARSSNTP